jgi:hypothetical protein
MEGIPATITYMAQELNLPVEGLMQRSVRAFLLQEMRATQLDISDFQDRYSVTNAAELRACIERGEIYSHPAWEDAIEWEHLETHISHMERLLAEKVGVTYAVTPTFCWERLVRIYGTHQSDGLSSLSPEMTRTGSPPFSGTK